MCLLFDLVTRLEPYGTTWILLDGRRVVAEGSTRCVYAERMHSLVCKEAGRWGAEKSRLVSGIQSTPYGRTDRKMCLVGEE